MIRKTTLASISVLSLLVACSFSDDSMEPIGGAGSEGLNPGAAGTTPGGTSGNGGSDPGSSGSGGSDPGTGNAGSSNAGSAGVNASAGTGGSIQGGAGTGNGGAAGGDEGSAGEGGAPDGQGGSGGDVATGGTGGTEPTGPRGLVAHFMFDEASGTNAADATGNFGPATLASAAAWAEGRSGGGVALDGSASSYVNLPVKLFDKVDRTTIATWVNMAERRPWARVFDVGFGDSRFLYLAADTGGAMRFSVFPGSVPAEGTVTTDTTLPLNVWKHVAVTVEGTQYSMFIDGHRVSTMTTANTKPSSVEPTSQGWLGKSTFGVDANFKGKLDDFRIYDVVLSDAEIADLAWPNTDYSYWRMDETSGTVLADSSDRNADGALPNGGSFVAGRTDGALALDGINQHAVLPADLLKNCTDVTIALWAKLNAQTNWSRFLDLDGMTNGFIYFTPMAMGSGKPQLLFNIYKGSDQGIVGSYPAEATLVGQWHHYAVTLAGNVGRVFFDGVEIGKNEAFTFNPSDILVDLQKPSHAWVGKSMFDDPHLNTAIDEMRVSCRAYTADEIKQLAK